VDIVPGGTGEFTVLVDGNTLWDKSQTGRFPEHAEIIGKLTP
jgi:selT/selW/selH-like putative selenoprotein